MAGALGSALDWPRPSPPPRPPPQRPVRVSPRRSLTHTRALPAAGPLLTQDIHPPPPATVHSHPGPGLPHSTRYRLRPSPRPHLPPAPPAPVPPSARPAPSVPAHRELSTLRDSRPGDGGGVLRGGVGAGHGSGLQPARGWGRGGWRPGGWKGPGSPGGRWGGTQAAFVRLPPPPPTASRPLWGGEPVNLPLKTRMSF